MCSLPDFIEASLGRCGRWFASQLSAVSGYFGWKLHRGAGMFVGRVQGRGDDRGMQQVAWLLAHYPGKRSANHSVAL